MSVGKKGIIIGKVLVAEVVVSGVLLLVAAYAMLKLCPSDQTLNYYVMAIYAASSFVGGMIAGKSMGTRRFVWGIVAGMVYVAVVLVIALAVRGNVASGSVGLVRLIVPSVLAGMLGGMMS